MSIKINVLVDDRINIEEHGLSILIEFNAKKIIFDTGQSSQYLSELELLGINEADVDAVVVSHGHYDHANGLKYLECSLPIYIHKDALLPKYKRLNDNYKFNGMDLDAIEKNNENFIFAKDGFEIFPNVSIVGDINNDKHNPKFLLDRDVLSIDDFHDEIGLVIEEKDGLSVFLGCSHFGVENALKKIKEIYPNKIIKNLVGGMHLIEKDSMEVIRLAKMLKQIGIKRIYPLHCTGEEAIKVFKDIYQSDCEIIKSSETVIL